MVEEIFKRLDNLYEEMVSIRRDFHMNPELSFQEVRTPAKILEFYKELGIEVKDKVGGRGVVATLKGGKPGKTIALRADFDALPIQDEKDVAYKSKVEGLSHACGHDAHTATLLGLAKALHEHKEELKGSVVFIHQFAEELVPGGAKPMIEDGCLDGVDAVFGTHIWAELPNGIIGYRVGPLMAAADHFSVKVLGKGGHGAKPHQTVDSVLTASQLVCNLQQIVSRQTDPIESAVITVGSIHGGEAFNVIADSTTINGTVRTFNEQVRADIVEKN